jgi:uncharacterized protein YdeI (YjbR/CyaY-like superfamily)
MCRPVPSDPLTCATPLDWGDWLRDHHTAQTEVLLRLFRKGSGAGSLTWEEAVVEALAWGWIDSVKRPYDDQSWLQRFSPRRAGSVWSQKNRTHIEALIAAGRMQPSGMAHVLAAQANGRWDAAYAGGKDAQVPADFLAALALNTQAQAFYATLNAANRYVIYHRLTTAKRPETRAKRLTDYLAMMARGEVFY